MEASPHKPGTLSRANKLILRESNNISVFSLQHWSDPPNEAPNFSRPPRQTGRNSSSTTRAKLVGYKIQETVLNFLLRWLINEESTRTIAINSQRVSFKTIIKAPNFDDRNLRTQHVVTGQRQKQRQRRKTRSSLLLTNANNLTDRRLKTVLKFVFWRWLTWTNSIELLLIVLLIGCCIYQCYELLEEYYQYPTHVSIRKIMNDDFYQDLPALTFCNNNRVSKETLGKKFPHLNDSHLIAITQGTFYSVDNYTINLNQTVDYGYLPEKDDPFSKRMEMSELEKYIDWKIVGPLLANGTIAGMFQMLPSYDIVDSINCANIWGEQLPCQKLQRVETIQQEASCRTLFHRSALADSRDPAVQDLQVALENQPRMLSFGKYGSVTSGSLLLAGDDDAWAERRPRRRAAPENDNLVPISRKELVPKFNQQQQQQQQQQQDETKVRVEMGHMEVLRVRLDFRRLDYKNKRLLIGGKLSIHSNSALGSISHIVYNIRAGFWYNFYVQRFDYRRLPPPYSTKCFEYHELAQEKAPLTVKEKKELYELLERQVSRPSKLIERYGVLLRHRSLGGRECYNICKAELSTTKCKCWPRWMPFARAYDGPDMRLCDNNYLRQNFATNRSGPTGDDLHFQLCLRDFYSICFEACPDECRFSSFDITQQSRSWPSEESQRYIKDNSLLDRLQEEAECCATISVTYSSPVSSLHATEPKYTRQDMVTIISGNIEAWIGLSAVHGYLFLEQIYDALVEAQLIRPVLVTASVAFVGIRTFPRSILTKIGARL